MAELGAITRRGGSAGTGLSRKNHLSDPASPNVRERRAGSVCRPIAMNRASKKVTLAVAWLFAPSLAACDRDPVDGNPYLGTWEIVEGGHARSCPLSGAPGLVGWIPWWGQLRVLPSNPPTEMQHVILEGADPQRSIFRESLSFRMNTCSAEMLRSEPCATEPSPSAASSEVATCPEEGSLILVDADQMLLRISGEAFVRPRETGTTEVCGWSAAALLRKRSPRGVPLGEYKDDSCRPPPWAKER